jgi:curved DNA-binding protein CbpA
MKSVTEVIFKDQRLLTRFILKLRFLPDTPALIQFVAGDEDYLLLCSRIANDSNDHSPELQPLKDICRKQEFDFHVLKETLTPVARAFGLVEDKSDYYELLGVSRDADPSEIKKAFRKKVIEVHPDTGDQISDSGREFISLQTAYQILSDPLLRQQYEENLEDVDLWKEKANHLQGLPESNRLNSLISQNQNPNQTARAKIYYQLGGLFLLLIIVAFIFDFLYRQNSIFDTDYTVKPKQAQEQKPMKAAAKAASDSKTVKNSSEVKSLSNRSDNSRNNFKSGDISQKRTKAADAKLSADGL